MPRESQYDASERMSRKRKMLMDGADAAPPQIPPRHPDIQHESPHAGSMDALALLDKRRSSDSIGSASPGSAPCSGSAT